ncbi:MAG: alkaline phosphatase family protein [Acidobacteriota bacterium]
MRPQVLIIGLDAATMDLILPWAEAGHLPALARLMSEGAQARLLSTPNMHSASAWTSILTGLNPGRHGLFVFSDRDFATGRQVFFKGGDRAGETLCAHLARRKLSAGFLNVPMTYPADRLEGGFMISGLDGPSLNERAFYPAELRAEIFERFPDYNFSPPGLGDMMRAGRIDEAIGAWTRLIDIQTSAAEYLIETRPVDFFMTVYTASDWGGHNLWKYMTSDYRRDLLFRDSLLSIYRALDRAVERLIECADANAHVFVISDHGMGPHTGASYHLAEWLEQSGYMSRRKSAKTRASLIKTGKSIARKLLPLSVREKIRSRIGDERVKQLAAAEKDSFYSSIDWTKTTAYTEPGRHVININLAGRNAEGIVSEKDYTEVCHRIIADLAAWRDEAGEPIVERVVRRDEVYTGPYTERASDLYIYWNTAARAGDPPAEVTSRGYWWSGDHRPEGILICRGPHVQKGACAITPTVYDLVPTVLYLAKLTVPAGLDGRVIEELCAKEFLESNPVKIDSTANEAGPDAGSLSKEEEELIEEKLRALGYL